MRNPTKKNLAIGLFGGTFDPPHLGHLRGALEIKKYLLLDEIIFIPAAVPPHKQDSDITDAEDRLAMLRFTIEDYSFFSISDIEIKRAGISYSIDTINDFKAKYNKDTLFFITGYDAFLELHTWRSYEKLSDIIQFIVMARASGSCRDRDSMISKLDNYLNSVIARGYKFCKSKKAYLHSVKKTLFFADIPLTDISSTGIRLSVKKGEDITNRVRRKTADYIKKKGLYLTSV